MKKKLFSILLILLLVILLIVIIKEKKLQVNDSNKEFLYGSNNYVLDGIVISRMYYGPPCFGEDPENDRKEYTYILQLNQPIDVKVKKGDNFNTEASNIYEVQLAMTEESVKFFKELNESKNKYIKLEGSFFSAFTGHHHTEVLFQVNKILK